MKGAAATAVNRKCALDTCGHGARGRAALMQHWSKRKRRRRNRQRPECLPM